MRGSRVILKGGLTLLAPALLLSACSEPEAALLPGQEVLRGDEAEIAAHMIEASERIMRERTVNGTAPRLNQSKTLGCLEASFRVVANLPAELRQGLFARPAEYPALLRFANASSNDDRDKDFRGLSIKLSEVPGEPLWGEAGVQDFLLNSHPVLFAEDPAEFLAFLEATADGAMWKFFLNPLHFDAAWILLRGRERIASPFDISYWSTTPYRFGGEGTAVKYAVQSCSAEVSGMPAEPTQDHLREAMQRHLAQGEACFEFLVQLQGDPQAMPIEDASVLWDEAEAPFHKLATLVVAAQDFAAPAALQACEAMRFNPWQSLPEHRPLGGINRVRQSVYAAAGAFRVNAAAAAASGSGP